MIVGAIAVTAAWLLWPLPDARFDWRAMADDLSASGACSEFGALLTAVVGGDAEGVAAYLEEASVGERCPASLEPRGEAGYVMAEMTTDAIEREIAYQRKHPDSRPSHYRGLYTAFLFWDEARFQNSKLIGWSELVHAFRCTGPLDYGAHADWYGARQIMAELGVSGLRLDAWEARMASCAQ